jgi:hypothetical protein
MGVAASNEETREKPNKATDATLYYFAGRGLADQIRYGYFALISSPRFSVIKDKH